MHVLAVQAACSNPAAPRVRLFHVSPVNPGVPPQQFAAVNRFVDALAAALSASGACAITTVDGKPVDSAFDILVVADSSARTPGLLALSVEFSVPRGANPLERVVIASFPVLLEPADQAADVAVKAQRLFGRYNSLAGMLAISKQAQSQ